MGETRGKTWQELTWAAQDRKGGDGFVGTALAPFDTIGRQITMILEAVKEEAFF